MNLDDIIYVVCLLACIGAGNFVLKLSNENERKIICTSLGLLNVVIVSGWHSFHCFFSAALGAIVMLFSHPSQCHLRTFLAMFGYLVFFRLSYLFGLPSAPGHTNMIQMILTLKIAGVAFEKTAAWKKIRQEKSNNAESKTLIEQENVIITDYDRELQELSFVEIFHYAFNYIGVLTGPYYRYRTYRDYFKTSFKQLAPSVTATLEKLKYAGLYCLLYLVASYVYPLDYALSDEFYQQRSFIYRLWYVWPTFFIFRMRMYTGLTLSECVCTMAGFGAYPDASKPVSGEGPKERYDDSNQTKTVDTYNFNTIENTRVKDVETCWTFREGMKHWNICVQYWLAVNVYKLFPSKKYRTAATLLCSAFWHGFRPGHYFCIMGAPFYVPLEDMWNKILRKNAVGLRRKVIDVVFWIAKFFAFSYMGIAFLLTSFENIWKFYGSVYHFGYVWWAVMMVAGVFIIKTKAFAKGKTQD